MLSEYGLVRSMYLARSMWDKNLKMFWDVQSKTRNETNIEKTQRKSPKFELELEMPTPLGPRRMWKNNNMCQQCVGTKGVRNWCLQRVTAVIKWQRMGKSVCKERMWYRNENLHSLSDLEKSCLGSGGSGASFLKVFNSSVRFCAGG